MKIKKQRRGAFTCPNAPLVSLSVKAKMIKISDLKRIKQLCFDKIAQNGAARKDLAVFFKPINEKLYSVVMSNGEDFARIVADIIGDKQIQEFQIAWSDFNKICIFFNKYIEIDLKDNVVTFKENKTKFKCAITRSDASRSCYFKFDFDNAVKVCMDEAFVLDKLGIMQKFALSKNLIVSTDGNFAAINNIKNNVGNDKHLFTSKFPAGMWFFNPEQRIIVSEDKRVACTIRRATGDYPLDILIKISQQPLNNWVEVNVKQFKDSIDKCSKVDEKIIMTFAENELIVAAWNREYADYSTSIPAKFDHISTRLDIRFMYKYLVEFCRCIDENGNLKILFDDDEKTIIIRAENKNLQIFGMGLKRL